MRARSDPQRAAGGQPAGAVTTEDVDWPVAHLWAVVAASRAIWVGRGMTLLQLTALHLWINFAVWDARVSCELRMNADGDGQG